MFRLSIDIPLGEDEETAAKAAKEILSMLKDALGEARQASHQELAAAQYRLVKDEDRTPRNYLYKNFDGHARTNKLRLFE